MDRRGFLTKLMGVGAGATAVAVLGTSVAQAAPLAAPATGNVLADLKAAEGSLAPDGTAVDNAQYYYRRPRYYRRRRFYRRGYGRRCVLVRRRGYLVRRCYY